MLLLGLSLLGALLPRLPILLQHSLMYDLDLEFSRILELELIRDGDGELELLVQRTLDGPLPLRPPTRDL